jgi:hypothetical protein
MVGVMECMGWYQVLTEWHWHLHKKDKLEYICEILDFYGSGAEDSSLMKYDTVSQDKQFPEFQMITAPSLSGSSKPRTFTEWPHKKVLTTHLGASEDKKEKILNSVLI